MTDFEVIDSRELRQLRAGQACLAWCYCPRRQEVNGATVMRDVQTCVKAGKCTCGAAEALKEA